MPLVTREAMLRGIADSEIIVGAYVDNPTGGICPMLAAHRNGGRTNFGTFARAWDQFTRANPKKPRRATRREVRALRTYLERSLIGPDIAKTPLGREVSNVKATRRRLYEAEAAEAIQPDFSRPDGSGATGSERIPGAHEDDLGDDAIGRGSEQEADRFGDVLGADHLLGRDVALRPLGHRRVDKRRAERRDLDPVP